MNEPHDSWSPSRPTPGDGAPGRSRVSTRAPADGAVTGGPNNRPATHPAARRATPRRRTGAVAVVWSRTSSTLRILIAYVALGAAIALVVTVGASVQPRYGSLAAWQGVRVDDIRTAPQSHAWAVDLAATIAPGAPPECIRFTTIDIAQGLVAVRADSALTYGFSDSSLCSQVPPGFRSRVGLLDTANGALRWVHDVGADVSSSAAFAGTAQSEGVAITSMSKVDRGTRILIRAGTSTSTIIESLSLGTGQVLESTGVQPWSQDARFTANGNVVAIGSLSPDMLTYRYQLRNVDDLGSIVWSGTGNDTATMIALSDRLLLGSDDTEQIPLATGVATRWSGPVDTSAGYAVHDDVVYYARTTGHGVTTRLADGGGFVAVDRDGTRLWSSPLTLRGDQSVTRGCLAVTDTASTRLSCLDFRTGQTLWSDRVGSFTYAGSAIGARTADVYVTVGSRNTSVIAVDGATGRYTFQAEIPSGSYVVAAGRTVAYALAYGISGARSSVIALDTSSGKRLWAHSSQLQVAVWGGHVVEVGLDGLARRLA